MTDQTPPVQSQSKQGRSDGRSWNKGWDAGYAKGYSAGYTWAVNDLIEWLRGENHPEAADALRHALSPEGVQAANERIRALYGSLSKLARESRPAKQREGRA